MSTKLKIGLFIMLLFAALFLFTLAEAPAQLFRWGRPLVVVAFFGFLIYAALTLLRSSKALDTPPAPKESCDDGCGCHQQQPPATKPGATAVKKGSK